jgi:hypothetical protein
VAGSILKLAGGASGSSTCLQQTIIFMCTFSSFQRIVAAELDQADILVQCLPFVKRSP